MEGKHEQQYDAADYSSPGIEEGERETSNYHDHDVFGNEKNHDIKYKTLSWPFVAALMISEVVSNGLLSLPYALATIGIVPALVIIIFLGVFATYTARLLIQFKLRHPEIHSMGDAGYILAGWPGRELLAFGTFAFAILAGGGNLLAGQIALASLSDNRLCDLLYAGIMAAAVLIISLPRTFDWLSWAGVLAVLSIFFAGLVGMIGAGINPASDRVLSVSQGATFYNAFNAVTNPVFSFAGHFVFFVLISEMKKPQDAMKAAYTLQGFATSFYVVFAVVTYVYLGPNVASPSFSSLPIKWQKATFGILLPNLLVGGAIGNHTASKLYFVRIFRRSRHLYSNTTLGWSTWLGLILLCNGVAFVLAVGVPIFNYVVGLGASLFAAWYTYGIAGFFWLYDCYHYGRDAYAPGFPESRVPSGVHNWLRQPVRFVLAVLTVLAGLFICVAGLYTTIDGIVIAYDTGAVNTPFQC